MIDMKPKDSIKLDITKLDIKIDIAELDKSEIYLQENLLPEYGL